MPYDGETMKKKTLIIILSVAAAVLLAAGGIIWAVIANKDKNDGSEILYDYVDGDPELKTYLSYDIADKTEAFYIGSDVISGVKINDGEVAKENYVLRNRYLLMPDGWYEQLGEGTHTCTVNYATKSLDFKITISDDRPLLFTMPDADGIYIPSDKPLLPAVTFESAAQQKEVYYTLSDGTTTYELTEEEGGVRITDPVEGKYEYGIRLMRKGVIAAEEKFTVRVVSREYYEGIIDTVEYGISDIYGVPSTGSVSFVDYTDAEGTSRSAIKYTNTGRADDNTRILSLSPQKILDIMRLGYTSIGFWYCIEPETETAQIKTNLILYNSNGAVKTAYASYSNVWKKATINFAAVGLTADMLAENLDNTSFFFGFLTSRYDSNAKRNLPRTVYLSEIVAENCKEDVTPFVGEYLCGDDVLSVTGEGSEGKVVLNGADYDARISGGFIVLDDGSGNYLCGGIDNGVIALGGRVYAKSGINFLPQDGADSDVKVLPVLENCGYTVRYFVIEDGTEREASVYKFNMNSEYSLRAEIYDGETLLGEALFGVEVQRLTTAGDISKFAATDGIVSSYLPNNMQNGQVFNYGANSTLYFNSFIESYNYMMFDSEYVQNMIDSGLTEITVEYRYGYAMADGSSGTFRPMYYDASEETFKDLSGASLFTVNTAPADGATTTTVTFGLSAEDIAAMDFEGGDVFCLGGIRFVKGLPGGKCQLYVYHLEFHAEGIYDAQADN